MKSLRQRESELEQQAVEPFTRAEKFARDVADTKGYLAAVAQKGLAVTITRVDSGASLSVVALRGGWKIDDRELGEDEMLDSVLAFLPDSAAR